MDIQEVIGEIATAIGAQNFAGAPLTYLMRRLQMRRCLTARRRRHHFFPSRSFSTALSSIASANIRLSLPFSCLERDYFTLNRVWGIPETDRI